MEIDLIRPNDFCEIITDKFLDQGVAQGQRVYIAGHRAFPENQEDPYTQRIKFFVHLVVGDAFDPRLFVMDPRSLRKVKPKEQKKLAAKFKELYEERVPEDGEAITTH
jgi:hypothetical protein